MANELNGERDAEVAALRAALRAIRDMDDQEVRTLARNTARIALAVPSGGKGQHA